MLGRQLVRAKMIRLMAARRATSFSLCETAERSKSGALVAHETSRFGEASSWNAGLATMQAAVDSVRVMLTLVRFLETRESLLGVCGMTDRTILQQTGEIIRGQFRVPGGCGMSQLF